MATREWIRIPQIRDFGQKIKPAEEMEKYRCYGNNRPIKIFANTNKIIRGIQKKMSQ